MGVSRVATHATDSGSKISLWPGYWQRRLHAVLGGLPDAFYVDVFTHFAYLDYFEPAIV